MNLSYCRSCNAPIVWLETETGKKMPLDHAAVEDGNIIIVNRLAHVLKAGDTPPEGTPRFKSHFATCPHAVEADLCSRCAAQEAARPAQELLSA